MAVKAQPLRRRRIEGRLLVIAKQRYRISLDEAAQALRACLIADGKPDEGHFSDDPTDLALKRDFVLFHGGLGCVLVSPGEALVPIPADQCCTHNEPEY
jgi:hypothetical protein